jgi:uncharacterized membrane protein
MNLLIQSILLSISPIFELRAAIPLSIIYGESLWPFYVILSILANIAIIPAIFYFLDNLHNAFMNIKVYEKLFTKSVNRIRKKIEHKIGTKKEFLALYFLVALPFPMTGVYTGTLAAWLFGLPRKKSLLHIIYGAITAGIIITLITLFFGSFF